MHDMRDIVPGFWKTLTEEEFHKVCVTSALDAALCKRLWALQGRTDKPPDGMWVYLKRDAVMKAFPPKDKMS